MTRAERSRSRLFDDAGLYGGDTKDLIYEQGHTAGSKSLAGKLIVPTEERDSFRFEIGEAEFRGVELVGTTSGDTDDVARGTSVTSHASTEEGNLLVLVTVQGNIAYNGTVVAGGWQYQQALSEDLGDAIGSGDSINSVLTVFTKRADTAGATSFYLRSTEETGFAAYPEFGLSWVMFSFRNAALAHEDDLIYSTIEGAAASSVTIPSLTAVPEGSYVVSAVGWTNGGSTTRTHTPPSGYTEVVELNAYHTSANVSSGLSTAYKQVTTSGDTVVVGAASISSNAAEISGVAFAVVPRGVGIQGWTGEPNSHTLEINKEGRAWYKDFVGDVKVKGMFRYQKPFALVLKTGDQNFTDIDTEQIAFPSNGLVHDDYNLFSDADDGFVFDGALHRGLWKITLFVRWEGNSAGRRQAMIYVDSTEYASSNVDAPPTGNATQEVTFYLTVVADTEITFYASQDCGITLAVLGSGQQNETWASAEYIRDLD